MDAPQELAPTPFGTPIASAADNPDDRRPRGGQRRAREVSSRYMSVLKSPVTSSSSSAASAPSPSASSSSFYCPPLPPKQPFKNKNHNHHLPQHSQHNHLRRPPSPSVDRRYPVSDSDEGGSSFADENRPELSAETPMPAMGLLHGKAAGTIQKKRAVARLFRENGEEQPLHLPDRSKVGGSVVFKAVDLRVLPRNPRPGTPMIPQSSDRPSNMSTPRPLLQSRVQVKPSAKRPSTNRMVVRDSLEIMTPARASSSVMEQDDDAKSVGTASETSSLGEFSEAEVCSIGGNQVGWCESPPIRAQGSRARGPSSECRSSMPEVDQLPRMSARGLTDTRLNSLDAPSYRGTPSFCHRSLNSALSSCPQPPFSQAKSLHKSSVKAHQNFISQAPTPGFGIEPKKARKPSSRHEEDTYALRLLENRYLQWRFVNAKAQVTDEARKFAAEKSLCGLSAKLLEMRDSVVSKRIELDQLKRIRTLSTVVEAEMSHLDKWAVFEEDHSNSLSGTIKALRDASLRLPLIGNIKADVMQMEETFESLLHVMDALAPRIGRFLSTAEGVGVHISDLASVVCKERALVEECGNVLSEVQRLQFKGTIDAAEAAKQFGSVEVRLTSASYNL